MLDVKFIRQNPSVVKENQKKRGLDTKVVDEFIDKDKKYRELKIKIDNLRHKRNVTSLEINKLKKEKKGKEADDKIKEMRKLVEDLKKNEDELEKLGKRNHEILLRIPNIADKSVPVGKEEKDNKVVRKVGRIPKFRFQGSPTIPILRLEGFSGLTIDTLLGYITISRLKKTSSDVSKVLLVIKLAVVLGFFGKTKNIPRAKIKTMFGNKIFHLLLGHRELLRDKSYKTAQGRIHIPCKFQLFRFNNHKAAEVITHID